MSPRGERQGGDGERERERKSQVDCSGACASLKWKNVRA